MNAAMKSWWLWSIFNIGSFVGAGVYYGGVGCVKLLLYMEISSSSFRCSSDASSISGAKNWLLVVPAPDVFHKKM